MAYDWINRFRDYLDNAFKDGSQDRWRKVIRIVSRGTRGTQTSAITPKQDPTAGYKRKPYTASGDYGDMMSSLSRGAAQDQYTEPYSERDKPYTSDGDYREMEQYQPYPVGTSFYNLPDLRTKLTISPSQVPGSDEAISGQGCAITLYNPLYCNDYVRGNPSIYQSIAGGNEGLNELQWKVYIKDSTSGRWVKYNDWFLSGSIRPLKINPPDGDWVPSSPRDCVEGKLPHEVQVVMRDGVGNVCSSKLKVFCKRDCTDCCVNLPDGVFAFDDANTDDDIDPGETISIYVTGGCYPFNWSISGTGYSLGQSTTLVRENTLTCVAGDCGIDYDAVANITVTDDCNTEINFCILSTSGEQKGITCSSGTPCGVACGCTEWNVDVSSWQIDDVYKTQEEAYTASLAALEVLKAAYPTYEYTENNHVTYWCRTDDCIDWDIYNAYLPNVYKHTGETFQHYYVCLYPVNICSGGWGCP